MNKIAKCFDKAASSYDQNAQLQLKVGNKLIVLAVQYQPLAQRLMDLGCGTGLITQHLAKKFFWKDFHAIDISTQCLNKAQSRLAVFGITVYYANFDSLPHNVKPFDILFSNMALHWSTQIASTFLNISKFLSNNGILIFSVPLSGTFIELQNRFSLQSFFSLNEIKQFLQNGKLTILYCDQEKISVHCNDLVSALHSIKALGTNHVRKRAHKGLRGKSFLQNMELQKLTYEIGYFVASSRLQ